jgi:pyrethroid hydrolase
MLPVEIRYLDVAWNDPETVIKLECSCNALAIEQTPSGWLVETTTFPNKYHYVGVCVMESHVKHTPFFELADGSSHKLMPIKVPGSDKFWWIQSSGWDKKGRRYLSELYRTAGRADLIIQNHRLTIENRTFNFTVAELEYYLDDFKNNLWMLILDDNSITKGKVNKDVPNCFNDEVLNLFHDFIQSVEKIIRKPGMVLTETQGKQPLRNVRPVPLTFREYVTKPNAKTLTSRIYQECYDTTENRFIHYCIKRALYILKSLSKVANAQSRSYTQKIEQMQEWKNQFQKTKTKRVDHVVFDNEIEKIQYDFKMLNQSWSDAIQKCFHHGNNNGNNEFGMYSVKLGKNYKNKLTEFFVDKLNGDDFQQRHGTYLIIKFPDVAELSEIPDSSKFNCELSITGRFVKSKKMNKKKVPYFELKFHELISVEVNKPSWQAELSRLLKHREKLERSNWVAPLTKEEIKDLAMEKKVATKKIAFYKKNQRQLADFSSSIPPLHARLVKVKSFFNEHNIKIHSNCPNTMVFIQNPSYASAKSYFKKISGLNGLDEFLLNSLMVIDDIGLVNVANLYEKWCLLQIIKVLHQVYRFDIEEGWQHALISAVLEKKVDIRIKFHASDRRQSIILTYEKVLESGKRPDFVIDLISHNNEYYNSSNLNLNGEISNRLVIDAKFRGKMSENQLSDLIQNLYSDKNYSEDGANQVFIIHPSPEVIKNRTSPLIWGSQCDYGQSHNICHQFGSIFLNPSLIHSRSLEHLQRLVGMFLQENCKILYQKASNTLSWHNLSCISCGNANLETLKLEFSPTKAGNERWLIRCEICSLLTIKTICSACHHPLFKNGPKWTYHRTRAEQMSNVVCPACENFL